MGRHAERLRRTLAALPPPPPPPTAAATTGRPTAAAAAGRPVTTLYVVRHGETGWNAEGRFQGSVDTALNAAGRSQADEVARVLAGWPCDAVASSPLQRTMRTAEAIHAAQPGAGEGLPPVVALAGLAECNAGELQGELQAGVTEAVAACEAHWAAGDLDHPYPGEGGESPAQVNARASAALREAAALGEHVIVACHGMTLRCLAVHCLGCGWAELDTPITNCCVSTFTFDHRTAQLSTQREKLFEKVIDQPALTDTQAAAAGTSPANDAFEATLKRLVRPVRGFPRPDATFADITPLLADGEAFKRVIDTFAARYRSTGLAAIAAAEARGFFFGPALAAALGVGFLPVRKPEQLPGPTHVSQIVQMDYGERQMEAHSAVLPSGYYTTSNKVVVVDDLLATGGSLLACVDVLEKLGLRVVEAAVVYDLNIGGEAALAAAPHYGGVPVFKLADFQATKGRWYLERGTEEEAAATVSPHMGETLKTAIKP